jgi:hypothetical protein
MLQERFEEDIKASFQETQKDLLTNWQHRSRTSSYA